ncbi:MAG: DNRLRE domain-containing protein [Bacteroidales bacterium]|nr:DNRLRE domain-containing protein [Bacteroidales bacterium]MCF8389879.1 DNRLRE domain-containing protein [Bacteroidales bacterium]
MKKIFLFLLLLINNISVFPQPIPVEIIETSPGKYELLRDGEAFFIKGGAGETNNLQAELKARGGNSIRTWGVSSSTRATLDSAYSRGLTVTLGLWIGRERDGFDYNNATAIANQLANFKSVVLTYKDHPALLAWGIGNEVDMAYTNLNVWNAVNDLSKMIHEVDGKHPTMTVTAGISTTKANAIAERAPDLDMLGINAYAGISTVYNVISASNFKKPYIVTEWGVNGPWEVAKTSWGAPLEQNSTAKASSFKQRYEQYILAYDGKCLGSYAFLWGYKTESTPTWFGLFVNSETTEMIDVLQYEWTQEWNTNRAPGISSISLNNMGPEKSLVLKYSNNNTIKVIATDPEDDSLNYEFLVLPETGTEGVMTIPGATFNALPGIVVNQDGNTANLVFNEEHNHKNFRVYAFARDGKGHVATANFPFRTEIISFEDRDWIFPAIQDAYVKDGIYENINYGSANIQELLVKRSASIDLSCETYLQFDLREAPLYFERAWLEMYGSSPVNCRVQVLSAGSAIWSEADINWTSKPDAASGALAISKVSNPEAWYHWDLTGFINGQFANNVRNLSFILKGLDINEYDALAFNSKESDANPPRMFFSTTTDIPLIEQTKFNIYPNPCQTSINVAFDVAEPSQTFIRITKISGQTILIIPVPAGKESIQIEMSSLVTGLYVVSHEDEKGRWLHWTKLIRQ